MCRRSRMILELFRSGRANAFDSLPVWGPRLHSFPSANEFPCFKPSSVRRRSALSPGQTRSIQVLESSSLLLISSQLKALLTALAQTSRVNMLRARIDP